MARVKLRCIIDCPGLKSSRYGKGLFQHAEFSFLPASKAMKTVSCITDFGVSTAIIIFFVGGAS